MAPRDWQQKGTVVNHLPGSNVEVKETRCLVFRKCKLSGRSLFFKKAVRLSMKMPGYAPGQSFIDNEVWIDRREYLLLQLKGL